METVCKQNSRGDMVPVSAISAIDKRRDVVVNRVKRKWMAEFERLAKLRAELFGLAQGFLEYSAAKSGAKTPKLKNFTITSYDGSTRLKVMSRDFIEFDERLAMAEEMVMELIQEWASGAKNAGNLAMTIRAAFRRDKEGNVDRMRILALQKLKIRGSRWKQAMDLINEARIIQETRPYIMLQIRNEKNGKWTSLPLQLANADLDELKKVTG